MSSDEDEWGKEIDIVIIPSKVDVLTDVEVVNEDNLFHDLGIPNYLSGEVEANDELSDIEDCNFQLDIDPKV